MEHHFNVEIAKDYGIECAIMIHNLNFWISKNAAEGINFYDGSYWTFNTAKSLATLFPYMNEDKICRILKQIEGANIIKSGNYNKVAFDKTKWYSFTNEGIEYLSKNGYDISIYAHSAKMRNRICKNAESNMQKFGIESEEMQNRMVKNAEAIPYINTDNKQEDNNKENKENNKRKKEPNVPTEDEKAMFEEFRQKYKGQKRGLDTELNFFIEQNKDWRKVLPLLVPAIEKENRQREQAKAMGTFFPEQKQMQTYLRGKNRAWEMFADDIFSSTTSYSPQCDGISLFWNEQAKCYITPFDVESVADGYTKENRPNGAQVMWRGYKYTWNSELKNWIKQD